MHIFNVYIWTSLDIYTGEDNGTPLQYSCLENPMEPGRLQSMGSLRVGHDWATSLSLFTFVHWRRKWQPTPAFLPGESHGRRSLVGCSPWGHTASDTTEATQQHQALVLLLKPGEAQLQEYKSIWSITLSALGNKNLKVNGKLQGLDLFHLPNKHYNLIFFLV